MTGLMSSLYTKKTEDQFRSLDCAAGTDGVPKFGPATRNLCGHLGAWYRHRKKDRMQGSWQIVSNLDIRDGSFPVSKPTGLLGSVGSE